MTDYKELAKQMAKAIEDLKREKQQKAQNDANAYERSKVRRFGWIK